VTNNRTTGVFEEVTGELGRRTVFLRTFWLGSPVVVVVVFNGNYILRPIPGLDDIVLIYYNGIETNPATATPPPSHTHTFVDGVRRIKYMRTMMIMIIIH